MCVTSNIMSETKSTKARNDIMDKEKTSRNSILFGNARPLLPKRKVSFKIGPVDDKPHFVYK